MIDFNQVETAVELNPEFILSRISEEQILYYYHGPFALKKSFTSKLRRDSMPSAGFYISRSSGRIKYHDFKTNENYDCFEYVGKLLQLDFRQTLIRISTDFGLLNPANMTMAAQQAIAATVDFDKEIKEDTLIQFVPGKWTFDRLAYWAQYEIEQRELEQEEVYPVDTLFINKNEIKGIDHLCFAYIVKLAKDDKIPVRMKIYCPYSKTLKWRNNIPITVPFGMSNLKQGTDHLIITKAKKDMMVLKKLFPSVIGTQNESTSALPDNLVKDFVFNFPRRTIIWDADETGVENCKLFNSKGFGYFNTPKSLLEQDIKDVADFVKEFGLLALERLLKEKGIL